MICNGPLSGGQMSAVRTLLGMGSDPGVRSGGQTPGSGQRVRSKGQVKGSGPGVSFTNLTVSLDRGSNVRRSYFVRDGV